ncbi:MAG: molybdate ABC transporter substrate-binding protein [Myxococcota bacterium]
MPLASAGGWRYEIRVARASLLALVVLAGCRSSDDGSVRVAAASDTAKAFEALSAREHLDTRYSFGASGLLAKQLEQGAPYDVFVSADRGFVDRVTQAGACDGATQRVWAVGRLDVVTPPGRPVPASLNELADARFSRIAIANPETAPYGRAALQALTRAALLDAVQPRLVPGDSALHAFQFVDSGNAEAGLVPRSLVQAGRPALPVDPRLHEPLEMHAVVCAPESRRARALAFLDVLASARAQALLASFGYEAPSTESLGQ